jgi:hypothetical protein
MTKERDELTEVNLTVGGSENDESGAFVDSGPAMLSSLETIELVETTDPTEQLSETLQSLPWDITAFEARFSSAMVNISSGVAIPGMAPSAPLRVSWRNDGSWTQFETTGKNGLQVNSDGILHAIRDRHVVASGLNRSELRCKGFLDHPSSLVAHRALEISEEQRAERPACRVLFHGGSLRWIDIESGLTLAIRNGQWEEFLEDVVLEASLLTEVEACPHGIQTREGDVQITVAEDGSITALWMFDVGSEIFAVFEGPSEDLESAVDWARSVCDQVWIRTNFSVMSAGVLNPAGHPVWGRF